MIEKYLKKIKRNLFVDFLENDFVDHIYQEYNNFRHENIAFNENYKRQLYAKTLNNFKLLIYESIVDSNLPQSFDFLNHLLNQAETYIQKIDKISIRSKLQEQLFCRPFEEFVATSEYLTDIKSDIAWIKMFNSGYGLYLTLLNDALSFVREINSDFQKGKLTLESEQEVVKYYIKNRPVYTIYEGFKISKVSHKLKMTCLNRNQTALLFDYLRKTEAVLDFDDTSFAKLLYFLTGHSEQNMRADSLAFINELKNGKLSSDKGDPFADMQRLKKLLKEIIQDIDSNLPQE